MRKAPAISGASSLVLLPCLLQRRDQLCILQRLHIHVGCIEQLVTPNLLCLALALLPVHRAVLHVYTVTWFADGSKVHDSRTIHLPH